MVEEGDGEGTTWERQALYRQEDADGESGKGACPQEAKQSKRKSLKIDTVAERSLQRQQSSALGFLKKNTFV